MKKNELTRRSGAAWAGLFLLPWLFATSCGLNDPESPTGPTVATPTAPLPPTSGNSGSTGAGSTGGTSGTGSSSLAAPTLVSPAPGSEVTEARPTLTLANSTAPSGTTPTYSFQVATDTGFANIVSQRDGVAQGSGGRTSWQVSVDLEAKKHFWRARAAAGSTTSPYSSVADFTVKTSSGPTAPAGVILSDPLTNGSSTGRVNGGRFISSGWQVTDVRNFIRYEVPPISNGYVEWDNRGLTPTNRDTNGYMLFGMWDPSRGSYRENPFRVHLQKLDTQHNRPHIRLRWIAEGEEHNLGHNFLDWSPQKAYHWRIEWGPSGGANEVRVLLDGAAIMTRRYTQTYRPKVHYVELGIEERGESVLEAIYSNVRIGNR